MPKNENTYKVLSNSLSFLMCWSQSEESHAATSLKVLRFLFLYLAWVLCICAYQPQQLWKKPISPSTDTAIIAETMPSLILSGFEVTESFIRQEK